MRDGVKIRDPDRIDRILCMLGTYWRAHPDYRLGQIIYNLVHIARPHYCSQKVTDLNAPCEASNIFYIEDVDLESELKKNIAGGVENEIKRRIEALKISLKDEHSKSVLNANLGRLAELESLYKWIGNASTRGQ